MLKQLWVILIAWQAIVQAQYNIGGIPLSFKYQLPINAQVFETPTDSIKPQTKTVPHNINSKIYTYGANFVTYIKVPGNAEFISTPNNFEFCNFQIHSKNAGGIELILENFNLSEGEKIYVFNKNYSQILGAYTSQNNNNEQILPISAINGEDVILEYSRPKGLLTKGFTIANVVHNFNTKNNKTLKSGFEASCYCEHNINCPEGVNWQNEKNAIVRISIKHNYDNNGDGILDADLCTGTILNNTLNDGKAYILTAYHCFFGEYEQPRTTFVFNYESPTCENANGSRAKSLVGCKVVASYCPLDFALLQLTSNIPDNFNPYFAGWTTENLNNTNTTVLHYPQGDVMKISKDFDVPLVGNYNNPRYCEFLPNSHWQVADWDLGIVEGGSSGAALFNQEHKVIGALSGGDSGCDGFKVCNNYSNDNFFMFHKAYNLNLNPTEQMQAWLDPINSGVEQLHGADLYAKYRSSCDTFSNILNIETLNVPAPIGSNGYITGHNELNFNTFAEKFNFAQPTNISAVWFNVAKNVFTSNSKITLAIWDGNLFPQNLLHEQLINCHALILGENKIELLSSIKADKNIFVVYTINYNGTDTFALTAQTHSNTNNTAYVLINSQWQALSNYLNNVPISINIKISLCTQSIPFKINHEQINPQIELYPNPVNNIAFLKWNLKPKSLYLYNVFGVMQNNKIIIVPNGAIINVENMQPGIYFIQANYARTQQTVKIIVQK